MRDRYDILTALKEEEEEEEEMKANMIRSLPLCPGDVEGERAQDCNPSLC